MVASERSSRETTQRIFTQGKSALQLLDLCFQNSGSWVEDLGSAEVGSIVILFAGESLGGSGINRGVENLLDAFLFVMEIMVSFLLKFWGLLFFFCSFFLINLTILVEY